MDLVSIIGGVQLAIKLAQLAIQVGADAAPYIAKAYGILFKGESLTDQERDEMIAQEKAWRADIDAAIAEDDRA